MIYNSSSYPASPATDSNYLFGTLGYFWQKVWADKNALKALTVSSALSAIQDYTLMLEMINSYSSKNISVFEKRNWYPILIYHSQLNQSSLLFGESANFGDANCIFGDSVPGAPNTYNILMPAELKNISIIVDQIVNPNFVWVAGQDVIIQGPRLFFYEDPFTKPGVNPALVYNNDGSPVMYQGNGAYLLDVQGNPILSVDGDPILVPGPTQDEVMILWCYNAEIAADNLKDNIGYMFGLNVPESKQGKELLKSIVQLYTNGPTINDIKALALTSIGLPIITKPGTIRSITQDNDYQIFITDTDVYRYPLAYVPKSTATIGYTINPGDVLVEAVELFDNVNENSWWLSEISIKPNTTTSILDIQNWFFGGNELRPDSRVNLPFTLPPVLLLGSYRGGLTFNNTTELVTVDINGNVSFPVSGCPADVKAFLTQISSPNFITAIANYANATFDSTHPVLINPVDFIFQSFLESTTALLRIKFQTLDQIPLFYQYFNAIEETLPPNIFIMILCDIQVGGEIISVNNINSVPDYCTTLKPGPQEIDYVKFGTAAGPGLVINDMTLSRTISAGLTSEDYRTISLTVVN